MLKQYPSRDELQKSFGFKLKSQYRFRTATADLLPVRRDPDTYALKYITVPKADRNQNIGSKLLDMVLRDADRNHAIICLDPVPADPTMSKEVLIAWYMKHGFASTRGTNLSPMTQLVYYPKG